MSALLKIDYIDTLDKDFDAVENRDFHAGWFLHREDDKHFFIFLFFRRRADEIAELTPDYNGLSGEALRRIEGNAETGNLADPEHFGVHPAGMCCSLVLTHFE